MEQSCTLSVSLKIVSLREEFSCGQSQREFVGLGLLGGHEGGENGAARLRDHLAMRGGQLANQAMSPAQAPLAADGRRAAACGFFVPRWAGLEPGLEIAVAEPGDGPLSAAQSPQQGGLAAQRLKRTITTPVVSDGAAQRAGHLPQGRADVRTGERVQITLVGRPADLGPTGQIPDRPAQGSPGPLGFLFRHARVGAHAPLRRPTGRGRGGAGPVRKTVNASGRFIVFSTRRRFQNLS